jgi:glutamine amidotransferase
LQSRIKPTGIQKVKEHLIDNGIKCRQLGKIKQTPECVVMEDKDSMQVGIIDYGLGNLFSIERAVRHVGAKPVVVTEAERISQFSRLILPGVGAFGDGIKGLRQRGLIESLTQAVKEGVPLLGICLGMQLLMGESFEFGHYKGLGFIEGKVIPFSDCDQKIPHIGWNSLVRPNPDQGWGNTILENLEQEVFMYFVHSFTVVPDNKDVILSHTRYGDDVFCSCLSKKNIVGCQFHPERSGEAGLNIYKSFIYGSFNN